MSEQSSILSVENASRAFPVRRDVFGRTVSEVRAVDGVNLALRRGETLGLVGESGCGKSTLARMIVALDTPTGGRVAYDGIDLSTLSVDRLHAQRKRVQMIFQDPQASLNPRMTIRTSIGEPLKNFTSLSSEEREARVVEVARQVSMPDHLLDRFPHELSGGQCQRAGIARAISAEPEIVVADEPVSALDVSIQAQILNLLMEIKERLNFSMIFVSHDLSIVNHIADRVAVMYLGRIVETGPVADVFEHPKHPYTQMLLGSIPHPLPESRTASPHVRGEMPSPIDPPSGCHFRTRCPYAIDSVCATAVPRLMGIGSVQVACHREDEIADV